MNEWMSYYEYYDDVGDESSRFGTSDPNEPVSRVSCGGCGALLHCQDISIPGYLPKELFAGRSLRELKSMICQRCHFLKHFNVALDVSVKPEEYSKIISCIKEKYAIAVIMVDLLDFPCSIWPDMMDIVGTKRPVLIVGNKVDLIPGDQSGYLKHLEETLQLYVEKMGVAKANIKSVCLISARTGFGVEDLITKLQDLWESKHRQDVYLLGCTNVGKSTLFNRLLQSDFCKTQARDLVQRATTSLWPGTTLNLLKFPILRPDGWRLALRKKRLLAANRILKQENQLKQQQLKRHRMYHMPSFLQFVGKTFYDTELQENQDTFCIKEGKPKMGIWERHNDYVHGRWCFDTPGVVHPDQILNILTTEELLKVIPRSPIIPRFFTIKPGKSLLLAGLGRIDFISSSLDRSSRAVVFSSENLPVTIVPTCEVEDVYQKLVGSDLFAVPFGGPRRLADWPGLQSKDQIIKLEGIGWMECCADVVLSSAGWISVCGDEGMEMSFRAWTPFARGIHVREPALLPFAIHFKGKRINQTPTYRTTRADGTVPN